MNTFIKFLVILFIFFAWIAYYFRPAVYYGDSIWEGIQLKVEEIYINLSPDRLLNQRMIILNWFVTRDFSSRNDYKMVFSWSEDLYEFNERKKYAPIFKGFFPLVIKDKCFIFEANADVLGKSVWGEIIKYKKERPTSISECKNNCNVYFTEKWLLTKDDMYSCD